jgi:hypothetical protein
LRPLLPPTISIHICRRITITSRVKITRLLLGAGSRSLTIPHIRFRSRPLALCHRTLISIIQLLVDSAASVASDNREQSPSDLWRARFRESEHRATLARCHFGLSISGDQKVRTADLGDQTMNCQRVLSGSISKSTVLRHSRKSAPHPIEGRLAAATAWPWRFCCSSGVDSLMLSDRAGNSARRTSSAFCRMISPPCPDVTRPRMRTLRMS